MKNEIDILRELLRCYKNIIPVNLITERIRTLEWVLRDDIQIALIDEFACKSPKKHEITGTILSNNTCDDCPATNHTDDTNECDLDKNIAEDDDNEEPILEFPDCLTEWERPFYGLMHEHPELKPTEIADIMDVSYVTARKHYKKIREKMGWGD